MTSLSVPHRLILVVTSCLLNSAVQKNTTKTSCLKPGNQKGVKSKIGTIAKISLCIEHRMIKVVTSCLINSAVQKSTNKTFG